MKSINHIHLGLTNKLFNHREEPLRYKISMLGSQKES